MEIWTQDVLLSLQASPEEAIHTQTNEVSRCDLSIIQKLTRFSYPYFPNICTECLLWVRTEWGSGIKRRNSQGVYWRRSHINTSLYHHWCRQWYSLTHWFIHWGWAGKGRTLSIVLSVLEGFLEEAFSGKVPGVSWVKELERESMFRARRAGWAVNIHELIHSISNSSVSLCCVWVQIWMRRERAENKIGTAPPPRCSAGDCILMGGKGRQRVNRKVSVRGC